jgi:hypothetical protein
MIAQQTPPGALCLLQAAGRKEPENVCRGALSSQALAILHDSDTRLTTSLRVSVMLRSHIVQGSGVGREGATSTSPSPLASGQRRVTHAHEASRGCLGSGHQYCPPARIDTTTSMGARERYSVVSHWNPGWPDAPTLRPARLSQSSSRPYHITQVPLGPPVISISDRRRLESGIRASSSASRSTSRTPWSSDSETMKGGAT